MFEDPPRDRALVGAGRLGLMQSKEGRQVVAVEGRSRGKAKDIGVWLGVDKVKRQEFDEEAIKAGDRNDRLAVFGVLFPGGGGLNDFSKVRKDTKESVGTRVVAEVQNAGADG